MSYNPVNWVNGETPINDVNLNNMDQGISAAHEILAEHDEKIDDFANQQLPEEYVRSAVDEYVNENSGGFATATALAETRESLETKTNQLSSEIAEQKGYVDDLESGLLTLGFFTPFERGGLSGITLYPSQNYRIHSKNPITLDRNITITTTDYLVLMRYIVNGEYDSSLDRTINVNKTYTIPSGTTFMCIIRSAVEDKTTPADIDLFLHGVTFPSTYKRDIDLLKTEVDNLDFATLYKSNMKFGAHQGARRRAPANTIPAFELAGKERWEYLWLAQCRQSADGTWYCMHDSTVDATTDATGEISSLTDTQLANIHVIVGGDYDLADFPIESRVVPTVEDAIKIANRYGMKICFRLGSFPTSYVTEEEKASVDSFIDLIMGCDYKNMIYSGTPHQMRTLKQALNYDIEQSLYYSSYGVDDYINAKNEFAITNASCIIGIEKLSKEGVKKLHKNNIKVYAYTNYATEEEIQNACAWGVDIFQNGDKHTLSNDFNGIV